MQSRTTAARLAFSLCVRAGPPPSLKGVVVKPPLSPPIETALEPPVKHPLEASLKPLLSTPLKIPLKPSLKHPLKPPLEAAP